VQADRYELSNEANRCRRDNAVDLTHHMDQINRTVRRGRVPGFHRRLGR
jgi:hypothetical protein